MSAKLPFVLNLLKKTWTKEVNDLEMWKKVLVNNPTDPQALNNIESGNVRIDQLDTAIDILKKYND